MPAARKRKGAKKGAKKATTTLRVDEQVVEPNSAWLRRARAAKKAGAKAAAAAAAGGAAGGAKKKAVAGAVLRTFAGQPTGFAYFEQEARACSLPSRASTLGSAKHVAFDCLFHDGLDRIASHDLFYSSNKWSEMVEFAQGLVKQNRGLVAGGESLKPWQLNIAVALVRFLERLARHADAGGAPEKEQQFRINEVYDWWLRGKMTYYEGQAGGEGEGSLPTARAAPPTRPLGENPEPPSPLALLLAGSASGAGGDGAGPWGRERLHDTIALVVESKLEADDAADQELSPRPGLCTHLADFFFATYGLRSLAAENLQRCVRGLMAHQV
jgi:hypothetical protein